MIPHCHMTETFFSITWNPNNSLNRSWVVQILGSAGLPGKHTHFYPGWIGDSRESHSWWGDRRNGCLLWSCSLFWCQCYTVCEISSSDPLTISYDFCGCTCMYFAIRLAAASHNFVGFGRCLVRLFGFPSLLWWFPVLFCYGFSITVSLIPVLDPGLLFLYFILC